METNKPKKYFFGWDNFKWAFKEFFDMYSNTPSYFSKKRFESSMAFLSAMFLILGHAIYNRDTITNSEILADATLLFIIAGYTVNQIQKEKKEIPNAKSPAPTKKEEPKSNSKEEDFSKDEDAV
jgi:hypothetical protein